MPTKRLFRKSGLSTSDKWIFGTILVFGVVGLIASFVLSLDEIRVLKNPHALLTCSFNVVLNCSTVMQTWQAHVFGFPNMLIGLMSFPIVITVALLGLSGVKLRWFYVGANIGFLLGAIFSYWLFFNSLYAIQVLCPWCLTVTLSTTLLLAAITDYNVRENNFGFTKALQARAQTFLKKDFHIVIVASWLILMTLLVFFKFGSALFAA
jgi:uncharacterized membrane protein